MTPAWIAKKLGISALEAKLGLERIVSLGLIEITSETSVNIKNGHFTTTDDIHSVAIQENHSQNLEKARDAIKKIPVTEREFNNLTLSANLKDMPKAKKMIREFIGTFNETFEKNEASDLFHLNVQYYPITKK